ncbi:hypothetical protein PG988_006536 [Apiospora saccharicola]
MDFAEGQDLSDLLQQPTKDKREEIVLDPNIDEAKLDFVYGQIACFMLELARLEFPRIGAISRDATSDKCYYGPFCHRTVRFLPRLIHGTGTGVPGTSRGAANIAGDDEDLVWKHYIARHGFAALIPTYCDEDTGPFRLFCDDLRPTNMLADPESLRITAAIDFEFTNALPPQFVYDPPWWLLLKHPASWLGNDKVQEFQDLFVPRIDQFIRAMERAEAKWPPSAGGQSIAARMRDGWSSGRFWFNYASRNSFDIEEIYWTMLHKEGPGESIKAERLNFIKRKMIQTSSSTFDNWWKKTEIPNSFRTHAAQLKIQDKRIAPQPRVYFSKHSEFSVTLC